MREAAFFYEDCRDGLGQEFLDLIEESFNQIILQPMMWRVLKGRYRRYLVNRFPYAIIYTDEDDIVFVAAVMHMKRRPEYWQMRIIDK